MGDPKGFLKKKREAAGYRPLKERIKDFRAVELQLPQEKIQEQGSRCMDCGVPFCHFACPAGNVIPDWNDLIFRGQWAKAVEVLLAANNFPEFTGRVCPALCESACVVGISSDPVTIRQNEISIIEWGYKNSVIKPFIPKHKTGKRVAVVGSGPAGMAAGQQLTRLGHEVTLFEADDKVGGILRYGIPDFKLEKWVIDRRLDLMKKEGLKVKTNVCVGRDLPSRKLLAEFDAICLAMGSRQARDIDVEGRNLAGIHFALDYLTQSNKVNSGMVIPKSELIHSTSLSINPEPFDKLRVVSEVEPQTLAACPEQLRRIKPGSVEGLITAKGKDVVIIGGGDTGADCVGTANRQGAKSVTQIELLAKPPLCRTKEMPWPQYPKILRTSSSHEEGCIRKWSVLTKKFSGIRGHVKKIHAVEVEFVPPQEKGGRVQMLEVLGSDFVIKADLVILAMGFTHVVHAGLVHDLGLKLLSQGNIYIDKNYMTSRPKVFAAGDASRGASLVIWAINDGVLAAKAIDQFLMADTQAI